MAGGEKSIRQLRSGAAAQKTKTPQKEPKSPSKNKVHQNQEPKTKSKTPQKQQEMLPKTPGKKQDSQSEAPRKKLKKSRYFDNTEEETREPSRSNVTTAVPSASGKQRTRGGGSGRATENHSSNSTDGGDDNHNQGHRNFSRPRGRGQRHSGFKFGPRNYGQHPMMMPHPMYPYGHYGYPAYPPPMMYGQGPPRHNQHHMMNAYPPMPSGPWCPTYGMPSFPPPPSGGYGVRIERPGPGSRGYHYQGNGYSDDYYPGPSDDFPDLDEPPSRKSTPARARTLTEVLDDITRPPPQLPGSTSQQTLEDPRMRSGHYREAIRKSMTNAPEAFSDPTATNTDIIGGNTTGEQTSVPAASESECEIIDLETEAATLIGTQEQESIVPNPAFQLPKKPEYFESGRKRPSKRRRCPSPSMMDEEVVVEAPVKKQAHEVSLASIVSIVPNDEFLIECGRAPPSSSTKEKDIAENEVITLDSDEEITTVVSVSAPDLLHWEIDLTPSDVEPNLNLEKEVNPKQEENTYIDEKYVIDEDEVEYISQIRKPLPPLSNFAQGMVKNDPEQTVNFEEGPFAKFRTVLQKLLGRLRV